MKTENFHLAITILSEYHSNKIIINKPFKLQVPSVDKPTIHIIDCVPAVISKLKDNNFMLSMTDGLLEIDDTFI